MTDTTISTMPRARAWDSDDPMATLGLLAIICDAQAQDVYLGHCDLATWARSYRGLMAQAQAQGLPVQTLYVPDEYGRPVIGGAR